MDANENSARNEADGRSNSSDSLVMNNDQLIRDLTADYSNYMNFDLSKEVRTRCRFVESKAKKGRGLKTVVLNVYKTNVYLLSC